MLVSFAFVQHREKLNHTCCICFSCFYLLIERRNKREYRMQYDRNNINDMRSRTYRYYACIFSIFIFV